MDLVLFEIDGQRYALPAAEVREILPSVTIVPLPQAPPVVEGLIDVRGELVPVLDVRARFRHRARAACHTDHLILTQAGPRLVAVRADRAIDVAHVDTAALDAADPSAPGGAIAGAARLPDGLVLVQDLRAFLTAPEGDALDGAMALQGDGGPA